MRRFFVATLAPVSTSLPLPEDVAEHVRVLRLGMADQIELFDGRGGLARATLVEVGATCVVRIEAFRQEDAEAERVTLVQCMPKGDKLEGVVRMATELGVHAVKLVHSEHAVVTWPADRIDGKLERLRRIASEAARQSERVTVPTIDFAGTLLSEIRRTEGNVCWVVPTPRCGISMSSVLRTHASSAAELHVVIGPEGGLSLVEQRALEHTGAIVGEIASHVLRVETAAPVAIAIVCEALRESQHHAR